MLWYQLMLDVIIDIPLNIRPRSLGRLIPHIEHIDSEHPHAILCRAIPAAANGDASFGKTTAIGRREVVCDGRAVADPGFPLVGNHDDGSQSYSIMTSI
jgi:hypothetical protein